METGNSEKTVSSHGTGKDEARDSLPPLASEQGDRPDVSPGRCQVPHTVAYLCMLAACIVVLCAFLAQHAVYEYYADQDIWLSGPGASYELAGDTYDIIMGVFIDTPPLLYCAVPVLMLIVTADTKVSRVFVVAWLVLLGLLALGFWEFLNVID